MSITFFSPSPWEEESTWPPYLQDNIQRDFLATKLLTSYSGWQHFFRPADWYIRLSEGISKIYWQNFSYCLPKSKVCQYFKWFHPASFCSQTLLVFIFVQLLPVFSWKRIYVSEKTMYRTIHNGMKKQEWHWLWYIFCLHRPSITILLLHYSD